MTEQDAQIERIKQKMVAKQYSLEPLKPSYIESFEVAYGIRLPEGYRRFLLEVDGANLFIPDLDLIKSSEVHSYARKYTAIMRDRLDNLKKPFPFLEAWVWVGEEWDDEEFQLEKEKLNDGNLLIRDFGCAMYSHLIVTGAERGKVWDFCDVGVQPTNLDYLDWWEMCILDGKNPYDL